MRNPFVAFAFCLLVHAAVAHGEPTAPTSSMHNSAELIPTSTVAPRPAAAALAQPTVQVASLKAGDLAAGPTAQAATESASPGTLELALAALALMSGIALRRSGAGTR